MWLKYGFLTDEKNVILVNTIGATLFFCYVVVYWVFTINKRSTFRQLTCAFLILISAVAYTQIYEEDKKQAIEIIGNCRNQLQRTFSSERIFLSLSPVSGYICCAITVIFFAAPCCMLMHVIRFKNTEILPFPLIFTSFLVSIQWFAFGLIINDLFLQIPNLAGAILSGTQLLLFLIYPNKPKLSSLSPETTQPYSIFNNA